MARTHRNRHSVPSGWEVRDGGRVVHLACGKDCRTYHPDKSTGCATLIFWIDRPRHRREKKRYRQMHFRSYRNRVKDRIRHKDWENIPRLRRTGGWLTW